MVTANKLSVYSISIPQKEKPMLINIRFRHILIYGLDTLRFLYKLPFKWLFILIKWVIEIFLKLMLASGILIFLIENYTSDLTELEILNSQIGSIVDESHSLKGGLEASTKPLQQPNYDANVFYYMNICERIKLDNGSLFPKNLPNISFWKSTYSIDKQVKDLNSYIDDYNHFLDIQRRDKCNNFPKETEIHNTQLAVTLLNNVIYQGKSIDEQIIKFKQYGLRGWIWNMFKKL